MTDNTPIQDTVTFQLRAEKTVVNDTVRITVPVTALVTSETAEETLRVDINEALKGFIGAADWKFQNITRSPDGTGYERVSLVAVARVSERENYNLDARAKAVSRQGLQLAAPQADTTVPAAKLEEAEKELRLEILKKAHNEAADLGEAINVKFRVFDLNFQNQGDPVFRKGGNATMASAQSYGSGFDLEAPGGGSLANAQKVTLSANVTLAAVVPA